MVNVDQHNVQCSCAVQCSMVQCCTKVQQFMRSAEVECTLRRAATLDTFSDQVNQASDPSNLFGANFGACHFFSTDSIAHPNPLKLFSQANFVPATFCPPSLSKFIFASTARAQSQSRACWPDKSFFCFNFGALNFLQGALCLFSQECSLHNSLSQSTSAFCISSVIQSPA